MFLEICYFVSVKFLFACGFFICLWLFLASEECISITFISDILDFYSTKFCQCIKNCSFLNVCQNYIYKYIKPRKQSTLVQFTNAFDIGILSCKLQLSLFDRILNMLDPLCSISRSKSPRVLNSSSINYLQKIAWYMRIPVNDKFVGTTVSGGVRQRSKAQHQCYQPRTNFYRLIPAKRILVPDPGNNFRIK